MAKFKEGDTVRVIATKEQLGSISIDESTDELLSENQAIIKLDEKEQKRCKKEYPDYENEVFYGVGWMEWDIPESFLEKVKENV